MFRQGVAEEQAAFLVDRDQIGIHDKFGWCHRMIGVFPRRQQEEHVEIRQRRRRGDTPARTEINLPVFGAVGIEAHHLPLLVGKEDLAGGGDDRRAAIGNAAHIDDTERRHGGGRHAVGIAGIGRVAMSDRPAIGESSRGERRGRQQRHRAGDRA